MPASPYQPQNLPDGFIAVQSSQIKALRHSGKRLEVMFNPNKAGVCAVWSYEEVPEEVYKNLMEADSIGSFYSQAIKREATFTAHRMADFLPTMVPSHEADEFGNAKR